MLNVIQAPSRCADMALCCSMVCADALGVVRTASNRQHAIASTVLRAMDDAMDAIAGCNYGGGRASELWRLRAGGSNAVCLYSVVHGCVVLWAHKYNRVADGCQLL